MGTKFYDFSVTSPLFSTSSLKEFVISPEEKDTTCTWVFNSFIADEWRRLLTLGQF